MSGHSKWSTIKRQKGTADQKRGQIFTKIGNAITVAVREGGGGDPTANFKLRLAIDKARAANMPKGNIQRAIERGLGHSGETQLEEAVYEGYGPGGVAVIVEVATDNRQRTTAEIRSFFEKSGGIFGSAGAVGYLFQQKGFIEIKASGQEKSLEEIELTAIDAGAEEVEDDDEVISVYTKPEDLNKVKVKLEEKGIVIANTEMVMRPITPAKVENEEAGEKAAIFLEKLEEIDEVQKVYTNADFGL